MHKRESSVHDFLLSSIGVVTMCALAGSGLESPPASASDQSADSSSRNRHRDEPQIESRSSPIAITNDDKFVWSVNPDNNSVSVFRVANDANKKLAEIEVGEEPWCVAIKPEDEDRDHHDRGHKDKHHDDDEAKVYVTNMVSGTVSVIDPEKLHVIKTIKVGTEPFGCALSPDGRKLYVTNQSENTVSVISTRFDRVVDTIEHVGPKPHGIAITPDGDKIYVTQLLSVRPGPNEARPRTQSEGADDGRVGRVTVIDGHWNKVVRTVVLNPILVAPFFQSDGNTLGREPLTTTFDNRTSAFPEHERWRQLRAGRREALQHQPVRVGI
jgi:YVTN family beta-propeller protein